MVNQEEQQHFDRTIAQMKEVLAQSRAVLASVDASGGETKAYLADRRGELSPEDVRQGCLELSDLDKRAELAAASAVRLEKLLASPYFARVDFVPNDAAASAGVPSATSAAALANGMPASTFASIPDSTSAPNTASVPVPANAGSDARMTAEAGSVATPEVVYLGRFAFSWKGESVVSDWRSPVAGLFYDFEPGPAAYDAPSGRREGRLVRKRQIRIEDGRLAYAVDSDTSVRDEVLQRELSRTSSSRMRTIVSSIQREQNAIIRDDRAGSLIIQGVAGSGKTSIALHRVAYLLYRQKGCLTSQSVVILSPNRVFGDYISGVLPELGEEPLGELTLYDLACGLLEGVAKVQPPRSFADEAYGADGANGANEGNAADRAWRARARAKSTSAFAQRLLDYVDEAPRTLFEAGDLQVGSRTMEASWLDARWRGYGGLPVDERLDMLTGDVLSQVTAQSFGRARLSPPTRREVRAKLAGMLRAKTPLALYRRFCKEVAACALDAGHAPDAAYVLGEERASGVACAPDAEYTADAGRASDEGRAEVAGRARGESRVSPVPSSPTVAPSPALAPSPTASPASSPTPAPAPTPSPASTSSRARKAAPLFRVPAAGTVEWEDAFPLVLMRAAFTGGEELRDVKHLVIDEMQDLTPVQHAAVARLFPCDKTILGDCDQLVDDREGLTLDEVASFYPGARTARLMRSYRSSYEIAQLAARVKPVAGLEAVERHGEEPTFVRCADTRDVLSQVGSVIRTFRESGWRTLGIICKSEALAVRYAELLACEHEVNLIAHDSAEFRDGASVCSVKMAKGLEFDEVVLLDADAARYAAPADRNLLYVAVTRAMHKLTVLYRGEPSPFFGV